MIMRLSGVTIINLMRFMRSAKELRHTLANFISKTSDGKCPFSRVSAAQIDLPGFAQAFDPSFPQP
jgi:hypothetical protein